MKVKEGVVLSNLKPCMYPALTMVNKVYTLFGYELTITSTTDGEHAGDSLHPFGLAYDCRIADICNEDINRIYNVLVLTLSIYGYDVILEKDHIHIEDEQARQDLFTDRF